MEMEVVLGNSEEVKAKGCSFETNSQENGVKVHQVKENVNKIETLNDSGVIEDCVMNGVSSLLKMKRGFSEKDNLEPIEVAEEEAEEEEEDEEHGYQIGDFVWGKIKNHPWWPGQIYDPLEASDIALKIKQKGRLLVAYFGDGTFAWCHPSQLKPFTENFQECSKISTSKGFISAVQEAVEEMGTQIERLLIHDSSEEGVDRIVSNSGIKEGVLVHDVREEIVSSLLFTNSGDKILRDVKNVATSSTYLDLLEIEVLKRKLSVFNRFKGGKGLSKYHEPQSVPGLEDKNNDDEPFKESSRLRSLEKCSGFPDNRLQHRKKEKSIAEILENEASAKVKFAGESGYGNGKPSRKKVKRNDEVKIDFGNVNITSSSTSKRKRRASEVTTIEDSGHGISERKGVSEKEKEMVNVNGDKEESTEKDENSGLEIDIDSTPLASLVKRVKTEGDNEAGTQTLKRERKKSKYLSTDYLSDFTSKGRKRSKVDQIDNLIASKENRVVIKPLEDGLGHQEPIKELSNAVEFLRLGATLEEMCGLIRLAALGTEYCKDSSSRDMVKEFMSIYRSFTYHDEINSKLWNLETEKEPKKLKGKEQGDETDQPKLKGKQQGEEVDKPKLKAKQLGEEIDEPKLKAKEQRDEIDKPKVRGKQLGEEIDKPKLKAKEQRDEIDKPKVKGKQFGEEVDKPKLKGKQQREEVDKPKLKAKLQREELDKHKLNAKQQREELDKPKLKGKQQEAEIHQPKLKAKQKGEEKDKPKLKDKEEGEEIEKPKLKAKQQAEEIEKPKLKAKQQAEEIEKPRLKAKQQAEEIVKPELKAKQQGEEIDKPKLKGKDQGEEMDEPKIMKKERKFKKLKKSNAEEIEKKSEGVELFITFGPGSSLPTKEDLIKIYEKFGYLDKERTYMFYNNFCARVAFFNIADGEKAFEFSQEKCPFGDSSKSTIKFRLKYASKKSEEDDMVVAEATMEIEYVKKKLEEMKMLLNESKGGLKEDVKMKLEEEMMNLMEKVKKIKVVGSS